MYQERKDGVELRGRACVGGTCKRYLQEVPKVVGRYLLPPAICHTKTWNHPPEDIGGDHNEQAPGYLGT